LRRSERRNRYVYALSGYTAHGRRAAGRSGSLALSGKFRERPWLYTFTTLAIRLDTNAYLPAIPLYAYAYLHAYDTRICWLIYAYAQDQIRVSAGSDTRMHGTRVRVYWHVVAAP
jgi:hypothetical protein